MNLFIVSDDILISSEYQQAHCIYDRLLRLFTEPFSEGSVLIGRKHGEFVDSKLNYLSIMVCMGNTLEYGGR